MASMRERIERVMANRRRRMRFVMGFACLALVVGLAAERGMRQQGITLTASSDEDTVELERTLSGEVPATDDTSSLVVEANVFANSLPEDASLQVEPVDKDDVDQELLQRAVSEHDGGKVLDYMAVDVSFADANGRRLDPAGDMVMTLSSALVDTEDAPMVVCVEGEQEAAERAEALGLREYTPEAEVLDTLDDLQLAQYSLELANDQVAFEPSDTCRYVLVTTSLERTLEAGDGSSVSVMVDAPAAAGIPANAQLEVEEIEQDSDAWQDYRAQALETLDMPDAMLSRFFDIRIMTPEGEMQPADDVRVRIELNDAPTSVSEAEASVVHFGERPEVVEATEEDGATSFEAASFSVYGVLYTVDFAYEDYSYALPGGGQMLLSELIEALHIPANVEDITQVEFSNPAVMTVERADEGTTIQRIVPDATGDKHATLVVDETVDGVVEDEETTDPWTAIEVAPGDYVLTSLESFQTDEILTVHTVGAVYTIHVTDPISPSELASKRNSDGSWNLQDVATINVTYDTSYTSTEQARDAALSFEFTYNIDRDMMNELRKQFDIWSAFKGELPTFTYDLGSALQDSDLANVVTSSTSWLTANRRLVAKQTVSESGKVTLTITDLNWFLGRTSIDGRFELDAQLDASEASGHTGTVITFPSVEVRVPITYKTNIGPANKTVSVTEPATASNPYVLNYELSLKTTDALSSLALTDTIGGKQQLDASSVKVNGTSVSVTPTSTGFTYNHGSVAAGTELKVTYQTTISADVFQAMSAGSSSWETNQADWTYNGDKTLDGGNTSYEVKKPSLPPPTIAKTSDTQGAEVKPGDTINYTLTIDGESLAGVTVLDNMTDLQYVLSTPAATVTVDGVSRPDLATNMFAAYAKDDWYSSNATSVVNYTFPEDFTGKHVVITYSTKVIGQDAASGASVYGQQSINNTLSENQSWQQKSTTSTVQYEKEVETSVTKSAAEDADGTITYTVVVGDGTTTLDGVKVKDVMSGNQVWDASSFAMSGNNVDVSNWHATQNNTPTAWNQTAFEFTFPAGTGKGPVTITYKARPLTNDEAMSAGVYGTQSLVNTIDAGTGHDATTIDHEYPEEPKFPVTKTAATSNGDDGSFGPDDSVSYTLTFGDQTTTVDSSLRITDDMTDLQKLVGDVVVSVPGAKDHTYTFWNGTKVVVKDGQFVMPTAANGWDNTGVTWGFFDDGNYSSNSVRVFNFQFPDLVDASGNKVTGPVTVTYGTTIISADEAATANVTGKQSVYNTALSGNGSATTTVTPTFPSNLNHIPALTKQFLDWDKDGYTTWWGMRIEADATSSYPLSDLTLTEDWAGGGIYYSTEYPVQNFVKNALGDLDLLGATVTTDSGTVLQAGRDYTIDKAKGSFHFPQLTEPVTVRLAIHNPDATINTFYQHNRVSLTYKKDAYNTGSLTAEAEQKRVKQDVDLTKRGQYDKDTRTITWTVIFNPYLKEGNDPDWAQVKFEDTLPEGLEYVDGSFGVAISGRYWANSTPTPTMEGNVLTVDDISLHTMYGANINDANGVGTGLNGTCYTVSYKTRVSDAAWDKITSSLTGSKTYTNNVDMSDGGSVSFDASSKVEVGSDGYLRKEDITPEANDGHVLSLGDDDEPISGINGEQLMYRIQVNPDQNTLNSGKTLTLLDRIDTSMELDADTIKIYEYENDVARQMETGEMDEAGITISYNDNVRYLTIAGLKDKTHYHVTYRTTVRAVGTSTYSNTATLIGGGSHSDRVSEEHTIARSNAGISGDTAPYISVKKIDENNIVARLSGARFELYKCELATDVSQYSYANGDWSSLLSDVRSGDSALLSEIARKYKIVGSEKVEGVSYQGAIEAASGPNSESNKSSVTGEDGLLTFVPLEEHALYYWVEADAPVGYTADQTPHYFTMYVNEDLDKTADGQTILVSAEERKDAAKALDNATQIANGITVAAMSADTTWNVTNVNERYTSITATKVWEGDYNNAYETRPASGIQLDLYQVDAHGNETLMEDKSPVPINVDSEGEWPSFTWYHLDAAYSYTVRERPVKGYLTSYSDGGKGVDRGTITVTNTFVPKNTEIFVQKKWDPAEGTKPDQVMVKLYQIAHVEQADGTIAAGEPTYTGMQLALTASNEWKDGWTGLPTEDDDGNVLTYTVVEDVDSVNKATGVLYGAVYSDDSEGVVSASASDPLIITNVKDAPGSLKITKKVTVNGTNVTDAAADGTYRFRITNASGESAVYQDGAEVGDVLVQVNNGKATSAMVDDLKAGTYYVYEYTPTNGTSLVGKNGIKLEVKAGVSKDGSAPEATFINNVDKRRVQVVKSWVNASGVNAWPAGVETQVQLMADGKAVGDPITLSAEQKSYLWDNLDEGKTYTVEEVGTSDGVVSLGGTNYKVNAHTETTKNELGTTVTLTNTQLTNVTFTKEWGADGMEEWPAGTAIEVQLFKDGKAEGNPVTLTATTEGVTDAREVSSAIGGGGYCYTWRGLEAGHVYSVREAELDGYLQQQLSDVRVRNVKQDTSLFVKKVWADNETPGDTWTVDGSISRTKRPYGTDELWMADASYSGTFTITNASADGMVQINDLAAYGLEDGVLYEYKYDVRENVPAGYTSAKAGSGTSADPYVFTNTKGADGFATIKMNKVFKDTEGNVLNEDDIPADVAPTFTLKRYKTEDVEVTPSTGDVTVIASNGAVWENAGKYKVSAQAGFNSQVTVTFSGIKDWSGATLPSEANTKVYASIGDPGQHNQWNILGGGDYTIDYTYSINGDDVSITFTTPSANAQWATENTDGSGYKIYDVIIVCTAEHDFNSENTTILSTSAGTTSHGTQGNGSTISKTALDSGFALTRAYPSNGNWVTSGDEAYWQADFGSVPLVEGENTTYSYYVEESSVPAGYEVAYDIDENTRLSQSGTITVTNTVPLTSVTVNKKWQDKHGTDTKDDHTDDTVAVQLYKARSAQGSSPTVAQDSETNLTLPDEYVAVGDPMAIGADDDWTNTWAKLPLYETVDGATYSLTYYVKETSTTAEGTTASYRYAFNTSGTNSSGVKTATITNTEDGSTSVVVNKNWTDGNANHSDDTVTFDLYRVATVPGALVVTVPGVQVDYGWITVKISDGANDTWQTLNADNNWTYSNANLDADKTYTVSVAETDYDKTIFKSVTVDGNNTVSGSEGGQINLATTLKTSLTISVPSKPNKSSKITVTVSDGTTSTDYELGSPDWTTTIGDLDHDKIYTVSIKSYSEDDFSSVTIDGADSDGSIKVSGSTGGTVSLSATEKSGGIGAIEAPGSGIFTAKLTNTDNVTASWYYLNTWGDVSFGLNNNATSITTVIDSSKEIVEFYFGQGCFESLYIRCSSELINPAASNIDLISSSISPIRIKGSSDGIAIEFSSVPFDSLTTQSAKLAAPRLSARLLGAQSDVADMEPSQHNLQMPTGAEKLDSKTITIGSADSWTHTWDDLPTSETVNGVTYNYMYYVKETSTSTSADSVDATYSYVYNTAGNPSSGVRAVTVSNKPTYSGGLKIRKTFAGLPDGVDTSSLQFRITAPDGTTTDVAYGQFTNGEYTVAETGLPVDDVYTVTELNAASLVDGYTLVAGQSVTSASESIPAEDVGVIELTNTYSPIKGAITVTKNVTLNGTQEYDDVAAGQRIKVGLERKNGDAWEVVADPSDTTKPLIKTITIGAGSTGSTAFDNLDLGTYRAYELADDGTTRVSTQNETTGAAIGGYAWQVTETGTYYTLDGEELKEHTGNAEQGVTLSSGSEDEKAPRNAEVTITNNKTETGSIKVNKAVLYNGSADTTKAGKTIKVGLYNVTPPTDTGKVQEQVITIGADGRGSVTFDNLEFGTYYVYELDASDNPVTGSSAEFFDGVGAYTVSANNKAQVLSHANKDVALSFTNSLLEKGKIAVSKQVRTTGGALDTSAHGSTFTVGLFTKSGDVYKQVAGRTKTVTIGTDGTGNVTFENLEFAPGAEGTTYYVFELDDDGNRLAASDVCNGYAVTYNNAGERGFALTQAQHDYDGTGENPAGATVVNKAVPVALRIIKVDADDTSTKLAGAVFTLKQVDETDAEKISYKQGGITKVSELTDGIGQTLLTGITNGYYEVTETSAPTGYVLVGDRTFYLKVANGRVAFLKAEAGKAPAKWSETITGTSDSNVLSYALATQSGGVETPATVTVGNNKGNMLPSSGGPGTHALTACGALLLLGAFVLANKRREA